MSCPTPRFWSAVGLLLAATGLLAAAGAPVRKAPTRPRVTAQSGAHPAPASRGDPAESRRIRISDVASRLGLKAATLDGGKRVVLRSGSRKAELEGDSRECLINGLRVFLGSPVLTWRGQLSVTQIDFETCLLPMLAPAKIGTLPPQPKIVALDPGHGGPDQGTENPRLDLKEKTFTLDVALRLKKLLERRGFRVVLTRDSDEKVDLPFRAVIANRAGADLFVSIHFNALSNDRKTRGTEVFTFAPQYQRSTNSWSATAPDDSESDSSAVNRFDEWSAVLAHAMHRELLTQLGTVDRGKKIGHLGVLRALKCPGVLVESGFLSNDQEARKIATPAYRQKIAEALADGVVAYTRVVELARKS